VCILVYVVFAFCVGFIVGTCAVTPSP
jgi:hypothetical protein